MCPFIRKATCQLIPIFPSLAYQMHINESIPGIGRSAHLQQEPLVKESGRSGSSSAPAKHSILQSKTLNVCRPPTRNYTAHELQRSFYSDSSRNPNTSAACGTVLSFTPEGSVGGTRGSRCSAGVWGGPPQEKGCGGSTRGAAASAREPQTPAPAGAAAGRAGCHPDFCRQICSKGFGFLLRYK